MLTKLLLLIALIHVNYGYKTATKQFTDILKLTYVYGDESAMLSHEEAMSFCRDLTKTHKLQANATATTTPKPKESEYIIKSDLVSLHDPALVKDLMKWIKSVDSHQFWIGGMVKLVLDEFSHGREHIIQLWTDKTPANFRFIQYPNAELARLRPNAVRCLSVDFSSGKWGAHSCIDKMYFVCETVKIPKKDLGIKTAKSVVSTAAPQTSTTVKA